MLKSLYKYELARFFYTSYCGSSNAQIQIWKILSPHQHLVAFNLCRHTNSLPSLLISENLSESSDWFIVSYDSANKQKQYNDNQMGHRNRAKL